MTAFKRTTCISFAIAFLFLCAAPQLARGDAAADLAAGRSALESGDLDKAQNLLSAAAQALPNSVEAQFALAECYLKLGDLEKALARYRAVLKLSPEHAQAKRVVAALTGERASFDEQLASAKTLVEAGVYPAAEAILRRLVSDPIEPAQRAAARLLLAETQLWNNAGPAALTEALRVIQESQDPKLTGPARVIAALTLLQLPEPQIAKSAEMLKQAGEVAAPWNARANLAKTLSQLDEAAKATDNSQALVAALGAVPPGTYRNAVVDRATKALLPIANAGVGQGDATAAVAIVWPMVSNQAVPGVDTVQKPVEVTGGWLPKAATSVRFEVARVLAATGKADFDKSGAGAKLLGYWLAAETLRQTTPDEAAANELVKLAVDLAARSRPAHDRKPGTPLSTADQIQRVALLQAAARATSDPVRQQVVEQVVAHMARYEQAGDEETGLAQFITIDTAAKPPQVKLVPELDRLPPGPPHFNLLHALATSAMKLGEKAFLASAATLSPEANASVNKFDAAAITLFSQAAILYPADPNASARVVALIDRYAAASKWAAVEEAAGLFYGPQNGEAVRWAVVHLKVRQALYAEDRLLAANRQLGKELSPQVKDILAESLKVLAAYPGKSSRQAAASLAGQLVNRYADLQRIDLAEAVIAAASAAPAGAPLADWALWTRAGLLERQAALALLLASGQSETNVGPPLHEMHKAELALLSEIIAKHPQSEYIAASIERVVHISTLYQNYRSFDVARAVIADFLKAHPKLAAAERLEYHAVRIALDKARVLFSERKDKKKTPDKLSDEFAAALDLLTAFLKTYPTGDHAPAAEGELLAIARSYGEVGAWPIAREVLNRFAAAVPDFRSPAHLKFLQAATYLGELDSAYGLALLTPAPKPGSGASSVSGTTELATATKSEESGLEGKPAGKADLHLWANRDGGAGGGFGAGGLGKPGQPGGGPAIPGFPPDGRYDLDPREGTASARPSETALAMVRQSQQRQFQQIAMLEDKLQKGGERGPNDPSKDSQAVVLPTGPVLSEAEQKRQDAAADKAYALLIELIKSPAPADAQVAALARAQVLWLFGFFEGQMRPDRAIVLIKRYLTDRPTEPARIALALQAINDQLAFAEKRQPTDRINQAWLDQRHERFELARKEIAAFIKTHAEKPEWSHRARLLAVESYDREAQLAAAVSSVRAGGLLVQGAEALISLLDSAPDHAEKASFPSRLWSLADRLCAFGQEEQAIFVLSQIPIRFPTDPVANQAVLRIAQLHSANLANPLKAVETYQEYLSLAGDNETVRANIFSIAQQLAAKQRYLESLHVYGVFVDSYPADPRAADALRAIGQTHQTNEAWDEAIKTYKRILEEYPAAATVPQVKLAMAECQINLSQWKAARTLYEEYVQQHPQDAQAPMAEARMAVLKSLDRYETLLADNQVQRNKDDAQFQIARIVNEQLQNPVKAIAEFRKVVSKHPKSDLADDAQLEIGKALLALNRPEDARKELLAVPTKYPNSPLADDALYLVAQSYEQQGQRLAGITHEKALAEAFERGQRGAYSRFNEQAAAQGKRQQQRRDALKEAGDNDALALDEASNAALDLNFRQGGFATARNAEQQAETESAIEVANRQDRINEAYREAVAMYIKAATDYPLGDKTDDALLRIAQIFETQLKDRAQAMQTYQKIVKLFPGTPVAEDAAWKVAQFHEREGKYTAAAEAYREFIRNYPGSGRVAEAQFALAEVLEQLGNWVDAMDAYETFRQKFASHPKSQLAMEQINWIKAYRK